MKGIRRARRGTWTEPCRSAATAEVRGLVLGDLVGTLAFLSSDAAAFITAQTLYVNGDAVYV
jgi:NAD(P)-dependent dehydrogenase (short-subunit alcohol dehydrogenase family)